MVTFREAKAEDRNAILNLLNQELGESRYFNWKRDESFWEWKYKKNVFGNTSILVAELDGEIVGTNSYWPWELIFNGRTLSVKQSCDTVIHHLYQGKGIFTKMMKKRIENSIENKVDLIFNFPNEKAVYGFLKLEWHYLAKISWLFKPLRPIHLLKGIRNERKADSAEIIHEHKIKADHCFRVYENHINYNGSIQTKKSNKFFEWRYNQHPFFKYGMCTAQSGRKEAIAIYCVYVKGSHREMVVVDVIGSEECIFNLFKEITSTAKRYGVAYVTTVFNPWLMTNGFWKSGFIKLKRKNMVVLPLNPVFENIATKYDNWQVSASMHDAT